MASFHCEICILDFDNYSILKLHNSLFHQESKKVDHTRTDVVNTVKTESSDYKNEPHDETTSDKSQVYSVKKEPNCFQIECNEFEEINLGNIRQIVKKESSDVKVEAEENEPDIFETLLKREKNENFDAKFHIKVKKPFRCELCHQRFSHSNHLLSHLITHNTFLGRKRTRQKHHLKKFDGFVMSDYYEKIQKGIKCRFCHKLFLKTSGKTTHERRVHKTENERKDLSDDKTTAKKDLSHEKTEKLSATDKSFQCNFCEKRFAKASGQATHEKFRHKAAIKYVNMI